MIQVVIEATVSVLIPEFELVHLEVDNGDTLSIGELTKGVDWRELHEGQRVRCVVEDYGHATRVIRAEVLPD